VGGVDFWIHAGLSAGFVERQIFEVDECRWLSHDIVRFPVGY
jgi:hypothetical protein